jgi:cytochrome c-type biogenesis protein
MIELGPAGLAAAFAAGFVSFLSPCVLPLVPGYLSLVSGVGFDDLAERPRRAVGASLGFVAGFGAILVLFGAGAAWFGDMLLANRRSLEIVAGVFIVFAGLVYAHRCR